MRSNMGWLLWYWKVGPLHYGMDLSTWGIGFLFAFRYPRGFAATIGPFYVRMDGAECLEWLARCAERFGDFLIRMEDRFDDWKEKRREKKRGGE